MNLTLKKYVLPAIGVVVGGIAAFFYWQQIGCNSGTCAITSDPVNSVVYGAIMGGLLFSMIQTDNKDKTKEK